MKKVILSIAIFSAMSLSMSAANPNESTTSGSVRTECSKQGGCEGRKIKEGKADRSMKAFEGINLTDAQKSQLESLRADLKSGKEKGGKNMAERKSGNKENLTAEQKQQRRAEKKAQREQKRQQYLDAVKGILTPEQYAKFLENTSKMSDNHGKGMKQGGRGSKGQKGMRAQGGKKMHRGGKADKQKGDRQSRRSDVRQTQQG